jgi:hypothetical protein
LRKGGQRGGGGEERRKTSLERAAAIEHGSHHVARRTDSGNLSTYLGELKSAVTSGPVRAHPLGNACLVRSA